MLRSDKKNPHICEIFLCYSLSKLCLLSLGCRTKGPTHLKKKSRQTQPLLLYSAKRHKADSNEQRRAQEISRDQTPAHTGAFCAWQSPLRNTSHHIDLVSTTRSDKVWCHCIRSLKCCFSRFWREHPNSYLCLNSSLERTKYAARRAHTNLGVWRRRAPEDGFRRMGELKIIGLRHLWQAIRFWLAGSFSDFYQFSFSKSKVWLKMITLT